MGPAANGLRLRTGYERRETPAQRRVTVKDGWAKELDFSEILHKRRVDSLWLQRGNRRAALSYKILRFASAAMGSALNFSMFPLMAGTPGPGQSVPHSTLSAMSSIRGKYSRSFCGGMPDISMYMFLWRRTRKKASSIHKGLPPWARITTRLG